MDAHSGFSRKTFATTLLQISYIYALSYFVVNLYFESLTCPSEPIRYQTYEYEYVQL